jgi:hypothetical protein
VGSKGSTRAGGRGALNKVRRVREGGVGAGQNVCTRSCVEGYRGISGAKNAFLPKKTTKNPPKSPPSAVGQVVGMSQCHSYLSYHNNTLGTPQKIRV